MEKFLIATGKTIDLAIQELWERKINLCLVSYLRIMERFATKSMNVNNWQSIIG